VSSNAGEQREKQWPRVVLRRWRHHPDPYAIDSYSVLPPGREAPPNPHEREGETYVPASHLAEAQKQNEHLRGRLKQIELEMDRPDRSDAWKAETAKATARAALSTPQSRQGEAETSTKGGDASAGKRADASRPSTDVAGAGVEDDSGPDPWPALTIGRWKGGEPFIPQSDLEGQRGFESQRYLPAEQSKLGELLGFVVVMKRSRRRGTASWRACDRIITRINELLGADQ
jgi:hypothetical protein